MTKHQILVQELVKNNTCYEELYNLLFLFVNFKKEKVPILFPFFSLISLHPWQEVIETKGEYGTSVLIDRRFVVNPRTMKSCFKYKNIKSNEFTINHTLSVPPFTSFFPTCQPHPFLEPASSLLLFYPPRLSALFVYPVLVVPIVQSCFLPLLVV
jgi:hypothetical protein